MTIQNIIKCSQIIFSGIVCKLAFICYYSFNFDLKHQHLRTYYLLRYLLIILHIIYIQNEVTFINYCVTPVKTESVAMISKAIIAAPNITKLQYILHEKHDNG